MDQKKINYLIGGVAGLLLIIIGVYYYQNKNKVVPVEENNIVNNEENSASVPLTKVEEDKIKADQANTAELKTQEAARKAKWNTAMINARTAFGKGEYDQAIAFYNEALSYFNTDTGYSGLFVVYSAQNNIGQARIAIDAAIKLNPTFTEYWKSKLTLLDEKTEVSYADLKGIYEEGLLKVNPETKVDLVTLFASIAERNYQKADAIVAWEYAKQLFPTNSVIYQAEIDRLKVI